MSSLKSTVDYLVDIIARKRKCCGYKSKVERAYFKAYNRLKLEQAAFNSGESKYTKDELDAVTQKIIELGKKLDINIGG